MKKTIVFILAAVMLALGLVSCKGSGSTDRFSFSVTVKGTKIELAKDAVPVLSALGEPLSETPLGDCGGLGETTKYTFNSFEIQVREKNKSKYIVHIKLTDDFYKTADNVTIGTLKADVENAYGEPTTKSSDENSYTYKSGEKSLIIVFREGKVSNLEFSFNEQVN